MDSTYVLHVSVAVYDAENYFVYEYKLSYLKENFPHSRKCLVHRNVS